MPQKTVDFQADLLRWNLNISWRISGSDSFIWSRLRKPRLARTHREPITYCRWAPFIIASLPSGRWLGSWPRARSARWRRWNYVEPHPARPRTALWTICLSYETFAAVRQQNENRNWSAGTEGSANRGCVLNNLKRWTVWNNFNHTSAQSAWFICPGSANNCLGFAIWEAHDG